MTISFIVTSYNYAKYIEETISSIKNQTYKDFEIIVVDDASKDSSVAILENISNIKLIKHDTNKGQLASILTGLEYATGEFISIIDSDDTISADYAEILIKALSENNVGLVTSNSSQDELLTPKTHCFGGWWWAPMSCGMIKRKYLTCLKNYKNTNLWRICPDKLIFNLVHLQANSMIITKNLVNKREHEANAGKIKGRFFINLRNNFIIRHEALNLIKDNDLRGLIIKSYPHIFNQFVNFCNRKTSKP